MPSPAAGAATPDLYPLRVGWSISVGEVGFEDFPSGCEAEVEITDFGLRTSDFRLLTSDFGPNLT